MRYYLSLFYFLLFISASLLAAGPKDWAKAFSGDNIKVTQGRCTEIYYFTKCKVPGPPGLSSCGDFDGLFEFGDATESDESRISKAKGNIGYYSDQVEEAKKQIEDMEEKGADPEEIEEAEIKLQSLRRMQESAVKALEDLKAGIENKKAEKQNPKKVSGKSKDEKKAPAQNQSHDEFTSNYYSVIYLLDAADKAYKEMNTCVGSLFGDSPHKVKLYLVTSSKMWNILKGENKEISPARNTRWSAKDNAVLIYACPATTNRLENVVAYATAAVVFEQSLKLLNPEGEVSDMVEKGTIAVISGLQDVVEENKVFSMPALKESELLLPSELIDPTRMNDPKRCLYFIRQSAAVARFLLKADFRGYFKQVRGGNSGFRTSYQFLNVRAPWAKNFDDFCNDMPKRLFFPLTDASKSDASAMAKWRQETKY